MFSFTVPQFDSETPALSSMVLIESGMTVEQSGHDQDPGFEACRLADPLDRPEYFSCLWKGLSQSPQMMGVVVSLMGPIQDLHGEESFLVYAGLFNGLPCVVPIELWVLQCHVDLLLYLLIFEQSRWR